MWEACSQAQSWQGQVRNPADKCPPHSRTPCPPPHPTKITHKHCKDKHSLGEITQLHPG